MITGAVMSSGAWSLHSGVGRRYLINNYPDETLRALCRTLSELSSFTEIAEKVGVIWHMNTGIVSRLSDGIGANAEEVSDYVFELWVDPACREAFEQHDVVVTDMRTGKVAVTGEDLPPDKAPRALFELDNLLGLGGGTREPYIRKPDCPASNTVASTDHEPGEWTFCSDCRRRVRIKGGNKYGVHTMPKHGKVGVCWKCKEDKYPDISGGLCWDCAGHSGMTPQERDLAIYELRVQGDTFRSIAEKFSMSIPNARQRYMRQERRVRWATRGG